MSAPTHCPSCNTPLPPSSVSESLGAARCPACGRLVDLGSARSSSAPAPVAAPIPERWQVEAQSGALTVRWRWMTVAAFFVVPFALFWNGILFAMAAGASQGFQHPENLLVGLVVPHVWVGVGLAYFCVALFFNSTTVRHAEGRVTVGHGPLWWPGKRDLPSADIQQLFVVEKIGSKGRRRYELCALLRDGRRVEVLQTNEPHEAKFLEVRLEQSLGVVNQPVAGEHR